MRKPPRARIAFTVLVLTGLLGGCGTPPSVPSAAPIAAASPVPGSPRLSPSGVATALPSAAPISASPTSMPTVKPSTPPPSIRRNTIATVVADGLRVRSAPGKGSNSRKLTPLLASGMNVFVLDGPVSASGLNWYQVAPMEVPRAYVGAPFGWVASGEGGVSWLETGLVPCPAIPRTTYDLGQISPYVELACRADRPITIRAKIGRVPGPCESEPTWKITPDWIGSTCPDRDFRVSIETEPDYHTWFVFGSAVDRDAIKPGTEPADFVDVDLTGHFDDAAAETCKGLSVTEPLPLSPAQVVLECRTRFVISSLRPVAA
jgi:hypothetical protein